MEEGYGVSGLSPRSTIHGFYAEAIELTFPRYACLRGVTRRSLRAERR